MSATIHSIAKSDPISFGANAAFGAAIDQQRKPKPKKKKPVQKTVDAKPVEKPYVPRGYPVRGTGLTCYDSVKPDKYGNCPNENKLY